MKILQLFTFFSICSLTWTTSLSSPVSKESKSITYEELPPQYVSSEKFGSLPPIPKSSSYENFNNPIKGKDSLERLPPLKHSKHFRSSLQNLPGSTPPSDSSAGGSILAPLVGKVVLPVAGGALSGLISAVPPLTQVVGDTVGALGSVVGTTNVVGTSVLGGTVAAGTNAVPALIGTVGALVTNILSRL